MAEAVKVVVRCRPLNAREKNLNSEIIVDMDSSIMQVQLKKPNSKDTPPKQFTFDGVYFVDDTTQRIYDDICFDLVTGVLDGYNGTVFAYGQTGCGKSFTMMGVEDPVENRGIIPRAFGHIFDQVAIKTSVKYLVRASYLEIYNEEVRDLLARDSKRKLDLKEHPEKGVYVKDLTSHKVHNVHDLETVMDLGSKNRSVGATLMNVDSSRSHSIFTIDIEMAEEVKGQSKIRAGRLNLVDLAGSERQSKTGATGERLKEATKINLSLSALGNVISALVDGKSKHIPYRDSKLTRLLQSSLGGNTKTLMAACISPADNNYEETLSTLRYANRAKNIKNKPKINEDPKDALLREYQEEIKQLKMLLAGQNIQPMQVAMATGPSDEQQRNWEEEKEAIRREYEEKIQELKQSFGKEKANKAKLEMELNKLQEERNRQLLTVDEKKESANLEAETSAERIAGREEMKKKKRKDKSDDRKNQEMAKRRLEELEGALMGGERADDTKLRKKMKERERAAESYRTRLQEVSLANEDDFIIEKIFTNLTEEVVSKTKALEKCRDKLESTEQEVRDLSEEFQRDREEYLDTIRRQDQTLRLYDQLLNTVVPLIRRDCNYYNMDKMKKESRWDREAGEWILPKVTTNKTKLSVMSTDHEVPPTGSMPSSSSFDPPSTVEISVRRSGSDLSEGGDRYLSYLSTRSDMESSDYFKPKRAQEILNQSQGMLSPIKRPYEAVVPSSTSNDSMASNLSNAAAIHGLDTFSVGKNMRRGDKLQSLPPMAVPKLPQQERSMEKLEGKRKKPVLQPLGEIKSKTNLS